MVPYSRPPNMPSWMSRIETQPKLFQITQTTGMLYSTAVQSTCGTIVKQPSPVTATTGRSGAARFAPSAPAAPKPLPEKPPDVSLTCARRAKARAKPPGRAEAHPGQAPRIEHALRPPRIPELHVPVVAHANVATDD